MAYHEHEVSQALDEIEEALKRINLWSYGQNRPAEDAFLSAMPFYLDAMDFHQWLEFVLIPRFRRIIEAHESLPENVSIAPYALELYRGHWQEYKVLIQKLREFDRIFSGGM